MVAREQIATDQFPQAQLGVGVETCEGVNVETGTGSLKSQKCLHASLSNTCNTCNHPMLHNSSHCATCKQTTTFKYEHCLECILDTEEGPIECTLHMPQLQQCCSVVVAFSYEDYNKSILLAVFRLRGLCLEAIYTLTVDNIVTEIKNHL